MNILLNGSISFLLFSRLKIKIGSIFSNFKFFDIELNFEINSTKPKN